MSSTGAGVIESDVPARMDRMPWSRWHGRVVFAPGIPQVLDGLEVQLVDDAGLGGRRALVRKESL